MKHEKPFPVPLSPASVSLTVSSPPPGTTASPVHARSSRNAVPSRKYTRKAWPASPSRYQREPSNPLPRSRPLRLSPLPFVSARSAPDCTATLPFNFECITGPPVSTSASAQQPSDQPLSTSPTVRWRYNDQRGHTRAPSGDTRIYMPPSCFCCVRVRVDVPSIFTVYRFCMLRAQLVSSYFGMPVDGILPMNFSKVFSFQIYEPTKLRHVADRILGLVLC